MNLLLLAQESGDSPAWAALRDSMRKEGNYAGEGHISTFLLMITAIAMLGLILWTAKRLRPIRSRVLGIPPRRLFQQAAKSLGIGRVNRFLLLRAAYSSRLEHPTVMLITPKLMETHAGEWADHFPIASLRRFLRSRVNQVAVALFGTPDANAAGR